MSPEEEVKVEQVVAPAFAICYALHDTVALVKNAQRRPLEPLQSRKRKIPAEAIERAGTCDGVMHPRRLDFLREHVVIRGAIAIGIDCGVH
jgi:hypothetical protein